MTKEAISTQNAPQAIGPYAQAVLTTGSFLWISGQIPIDPATGEFFSDTIEGQTAQCLRNIKAILAEVGATLANVVSTTVMLTDMNEFSAMNDVYAEFFQEPYPARAAYQVGALPKGAKVEIQCVAYLDA